MLFLKQILKEINKKGVSATVISIILLIVGMALVVVLIIYMGRLGKENVNETLTLVDIIKGG